MMRFAQRRYFDTFKIKEFSSLDLPIQPVNKLIPSKSSAVTSHWKWKRKKVSYQKIEENNFFSQQPMYHYHSCWVPTLSLHIAK